MLKVWTDDTEAGLLDRFGDRGSTFVYLPGATAVRGVSVTMPVRLPSWDMEYRPCHPIFEMNLPEGVLRERLRLAFAKATGTFDDFDLLAAWSGARRWVGFATRAKKSNYTGCSLPISR
jgi:serine/threonine-protein kinase HipA